MPSPPKVALIIISDLEFGGAQRQVVELCNHMDPDRFEMHVCSLSSYIPLAEKLTIPKTRIYIIEKKSKWDLSVVFKLRKLIQSIGAKAVNTYLFDASISGRLACTFRSQTCMIDSERNCINYFKKRQIIAFGLTKYCVDGVIANSTAGANFNRETLGMKQELYRVIHNGVDTTRFKPMEAKRAREQLGLEKEGSLIGMFASFKPQKNHHLLLRSMETVTQRFPDAKLLLVGDELHGGMSDSSDFKESIIQQIETSGLKDRCILLGNRSDVEGIYPACDVTVLPSLYEGTPNVALESMACGVPVIATDVSDNSYVIPNGETGYIVPLQDESILADRICTVISDPEHRRVLSKKAHEWILKEFSCQRLSEKTADAYDAILAP